MDSHFIALYSYVTRKVGIGFSLGPWPIQSLVLIYLSSVRHRFHLMKWASNSTGKWLVTPTMSVPLLYQQTMEGRSLV